MKDISITIVAFNNQNDVEKAVKSIELYTSKEIKKIIYIIDNSTEENSLYLLEKKYNDLKYIVSQKNLGFGKAHNLLLGNLDSKYHAIVNPDIIINEDVFNKILNFMKDQTIGIAVPKILDEYGNLQYVYRKEITVVDIFIRMFMSKYFKKRQFYHTLRYMDYNKPFQVPFAQGSFLVIRTDLWNKIEGFDDRYFMYMEDADLCKRVNECSKVMYCPYAKVIHKWQKGSHKELRLLQIHVNSMLKYFKKWGIKFV